jgi:hypothetical protein
MYRIIDEPNINRRISSKDAYNAQIVVHAKRLMRNTTHFTNEELFEISLAWEDTELIQQWTPESYRRSKLKNNNKYLLIKTLK